MINHRALLFYLLLSFILAWTLFLLPLAFGEVGSQSRQAATTILFALAMWMPGISAIVVTLFVKREKFKSLNLNRLGPKRYYLWAWLLFPVLGILAGILTLVFGAGQLDLEFSMIKQAITQEQGALNAVASLPMLFLAGVDISIGGTIASVIGWLSLALFVAWLSLTKRFPVQDPAFEVVDEPSEA